MRSDEAEAVKAAGALLQSAMPDWRRWHGGSERV